MPLKKDGTGKRWVEMQFVVPGTPEQLWQAMATGPGYSAWFTPTTLEERVGGKLRFQFGDAGSSSGEVTAWEPPRRLDFVEREWNGDAPPVFTEITIEARSGSQCVVRMVHSLFSSTDDWDDQLEGFEGGWPAFFEVLRVYLTDFAGQRGASFQVMGPLPQASPAAWKRLAAALGVAGADVGDSRTLAQPEPLKGTVAQVHQDPRQSWMLLRLQAPAAGTAIVGTCGDDTTNASVSMFFYGEDAEARRDASEPKWRAWFAQEFGTAK